METPIYDRLCAYKNKNKISFAMPSHKGAKGLCDNLFSLDVTELSDTVDLIHPDSATQKTLSRLSDIYSSEKSFIITCGSTLAIQVMICSTLKGGDTLLASSDCHTSVINICSILGINIRLIPKEYDKVSAIPTKTPSVQDMLQKYPDIKACLVTSPNYFGVCSEIKSLAKECHAHNIPLLVDEAHGAHFVASENLPKTAIELGADISCQSAHKTLNALTGASFLHIKSDIISPKKLEAVLCMLHTSSPSYPIVASAEIAINSLTADLWNKLFVLCKKIKQDIEQKTLVKFLKNDDATRLVACFDRYDISGFEISKILSEKYNIDVEMATPSSIVLIASPWNEESDFEKVAKSIIEIATNLKKKTTKREFFVPVHTDKLIKPRPFDSTKAISIDKSVSKICANTITVYPPGIPILYPGSQITQPAIDYILSAKKQGALITGLFDDNITITEEKI